MKLLKILESLLHVSGCIVLMYGVTVTIFMIAGTTEQRPLGFHPVQFGLIFAAVFAVVGSAMLVASNTIRKRL